MSPKEPKVGWYVDVPADLMAEFKRQYPGRGAMTKLTIAAIERALKVRPLIEPTTGGQENQDRQLCSDDASDLSGEVRSEDERGLDFSA
jgi:hypothetical protein